MMVCCSCMDLKFSCYLSETDTRSESTSKESPCCVQTFRVIWWKRGKDATLEELSSHAADSAVG